MKKTLMAVAWLCCAPTHADISVDDGYGEAGIAAAPLIAGFDQQVVDVAIDAQGRAVVVGQTYVPPAGFFTWQLAVARFNADGTPDNTFSGDGRLHMAACMPLTGADSDATAVLIQPDGKILVAGTCHSAPSRAVLLRFLADGSLDEDFGEGGVAIFSGEPGTGGINAYAIGLQSDGRIVLAGQIGVNTFPPRALVMRANVDGTLDTTFASGGYHVAAMNDSWYLALEVMDDDRIVVAGHANARSGFPADYNFLVARLEAGGAPDGTFNGNGFIDLDVPPMPTVPTLPASSQEFVNGLAIRPDGRIVIAGSASGNGSSNRHPVVAQLLANGPLDGDFGEGGYRVLSDGTGDRQAMSVFVRAAGDLVVIGNNMTPVQLAPDGGAYIAYPPTAPHWHGTMQADGHLVAGTRASSDFAATRLLVSDASFPDDTPDAFSFPARTQVALGTVVTSDPVTITGIDTPALVSVVAGEYSLGCTGTWLSASQSESVLPGGTVCVRHTSSATSSTTVTTTLTVGGAAGTFSSTTGDGVPDAFAFVDRTNVATSTAIESAPVTITGITLDAPISVSGGEMSVGCNGTFTAAATMIANGQIVCVRHTSAAGAAATTSTTLTVGTVSDVFQSTTAAAVAPGGGGNGGSSNGGGGGGGSFDWWMLAWLAIVVMIRRPDFCRFMWVQRTRAHGFP